MKGRLIVLMVFSVFLLGGMSSCSNSKKVASTDKDKSVSATPKKAKSSTVSPSMATYDDPAKWHNAEFNTSAKCSQCTGYVKQALLSQRGIKDVKLDETTGKVSLIYHETLSSKEDILKMFSMSGFDVNGMSANEAAKAKLPECCR